MQIRENMAEDSLASESNPKIKMSPRKLDDIWTKAFLSLDSLDNSALITFLEQIVDAR